MGGLIRACRLGGPRAETSLPEKVSIIAPKINEKYVHTISKRFLLIF